MEKRIEEDDIGVAVSFKTGILEGVDRSKILKKYSKEKKDSQEDKWEEYVVFSKSGEKKYCVRTLTVQNDSVKEIEELTKRFELAKMLSAECCFIQKAIHMDKYEDSAKHTVNFEALYEYAGEDIQSMLQNGWSLGKYKLLIAYQAANALEFAHTNRGTGHFNLSLNDILFRNNSVKVRNFRLSKDHLKEKANTVYRGMSPKKLCCEDIQFPPEVDDTLPEQSDEKFDVYLWGLLFLSILEKENTWAKTYSHKRVDDKEKSYKRLQDSVSSCIVHGIEQPAVEEFQAMIKACLNYYPAARPSFRNIKNKWGEFFKESFIYSNTRINIDLLAVYKAEGKALRKVFALSPNAGFELKNTMTLLTQSVMKICLDNTNFSKNKFYNLVTKSEENSSVTIENIRATEDLVATASGLVPYNLLLQVRCSGPYFQDNSGKGFPIFANVLKNSKHLISLHLIQFALGDEGAKFLVRALKRNKSLIDFSINDCGLRLYGGLYLGPWLKKNDTLIKFDIGGNQLSDNGVRAICIGINTNRTLTELACDQSFFDMPYIETIQEMFALNCALTKLKLYENEWKKKDALEIGKAMSTASTLRLLDASNNKLGSRCMDKVCKGLKDNMSIRLMNIDKNCLREEGAKALGETMSFNTTLTYISMKENNIGNGGIAEFLNSLKYNRTLEVLIIDDNDLFDMAGVAISEALKKNNTLIGLSVANNKISIAGGQALAFMLKKNSGLERLNLGSNSLTSVGVIPILKAIRKMNKTLTQLNMLSNGLETDERTVSDLKREIRKDIEITIDSQKSSDTEKKVEPRDLTHLEIPQIPGDTWKRILEGPKEEIYTIPTPDMKIETSIYLIRDSHQLPEYVLKKIRFLGKTSKETIAELEKEFMITMDLEFRKPSVLLPAGIMSRDSKLGEQSLELLYKCEGNHLLSKENALLSEEEIMLIAYQIADLMCFAHEENTCSFDINPYNIFYHRGVAKLRSVGGLRKQKIKEIQQFEPPKKKSLEVPKKIIKPAEKAPPKPSNNNSDPSSQKGEGKGGQIKEGNDQKAGKEEVKKEPEVEEKPIAEKNEPICYFPPEIRGSADPSSNEKSLDVFMWGMTFLDILIRKGLISSTIELEMYATSAELHKKITKAVAELKFKTLTPLYAAAFQSLIKMALKKRPETRPTFLQIKNFFTSDVINNLMASKASAEEGMKSQALENAPIVSNRTLLGKKLTMFGKARNLEVTLPSEMIKALRNFKIKIKKCVLAKQKSLLRQNIFYAETLNFKTNILEYTTKKKPEDVDLTAIGEALKINRVLDTIHLPYCAFSAYGFSKLLKAFEVRKTIINELNVSGNHLGVAGAKAIKSILLTNFDMRKLYVSWCDFGVNGAEHLACGIAENKTLRVLKMNGNRIQPRGAKFIGEALRNNGTLHELHISKNLLGAEGAMSLSANLEVNRGIHSLEMADNYIGALGWLAIGRMLRMKKAFFQHLGYNKFVLDDNKIVEPSIICLCEMILDSPIDELSMNNNDIGVVGTTILADFIKKNKNLKSLSLKNNFLQWKEGVKIAKALEVNNTLRKISLDNNNIGGPGGTALGAALEINRSLRIVSVDRNSIDDIGIIPIIEALKTNMIVRKLSIKDNMIGDEATEVMGYMLKVNTGLQELNLDENNIEDKAATGLVEGLKVNTALKVLHLDKNYIGDLGAIAISEAIAVNYSLSLLYLRNVHIADKGALAIGKALESNQTLSRVYLMKDRVSDNTLRILTSKRISE